MLEQAGIEIQDRKVILLGNGGAAQAVQAVLEEFADSSINVNVRMMVNTPGYGDYRALKGRINLAVMHLMAEEGLSFAFPSRSVYVEKNAQ